ncbi:MAG: methionyl-tRNA formyltransferase [Candidatus Dormibacteria bacterium]
MTAASPWLDAVRAELLAQDSLSFIPDRDLPRPLGAAISQHGRARVAFLGFPSEFSLAFLLDLLRCDVEVVGIVTSPGAHPAILADNGLTRIADHLGVPLLRAWRINDPHTRQDLQRLAPDGCVMASFDQIVHAPTLAIPVHGFLNVHPSKLPAYRGPEPVYWAVADGAETTGISLHRAVAKVDAGPILAQASVRIDSHDTAGRLTRRLTEAGTQLLGAAVDALLDDAVGDQPEFERGSYRPSVGHRRLDVAGSAVIAERMVRAGVPDIAAWTQVDGAPLYVIAAEIDGSGGPRLHFADGDLVITASSRTCRCHHDLEDCPHRQ